MFGANLPPPTSNLLDAPIVKKEFVVEGPPALFTGENFYDGVGNPLVETLTKPLHKADIPVFEQQIGALEKWSPIDEPLGPIQPDFVGPALPPGFGGEKISESSALPLF